MDNPIDHEKKLLSVVLRNTLPFMNDRFFVKVSQSFPSNMILKEITILYKDYLPSIE